MASLTKDKTGQEDVLYTLLKVYSGDDQGNNLAAENLNHFKDIKC
jgi:hypothetical protein